MFSDKRKLCNNNLDGVRHRVGERYVDACVLERNPWDGPGVIVLGGIGINQRVGPVIFQNLVPGRGNSVTEQRYIEQMFIHSNRPILCRGYTILQQDNTHSPSASDTHHNIRTIPGPSPNPDQNPIKHLFDDLQTRLNQVSPRPATPADLRWTNLDAWTNIHRTTLNRLVHAIP